MLRFFSSNIYPPQQTEADLDSLVSLVCSLIFHRFAASNLASGPEVFLLFKQKLHAVFGYVES